MVFRKIYPQMLIGNFAGIAIYNYTDIMFLTIDP